MEASLRQAIPAAEAYAKTHEGTYAGMTVATLEAIDPAVDRTRMVLAGVTAEDYYLGYGAAGHTARFVRSSGVVEVDDGGCP